MLRKIFVFLAFVGMSTSALAQGGMGGGAPELFIPDVDKESFIWQKPDKWYPYYKESEVKIDTYLFPTGQEPSDWDESLHFERFLTTLGVTDVRQVFDLKTQANANSCSEYEVEIGREMPENGYGMIQWQETCSTGEDSVLFTLNKAILGNEQLYTVKRIWKFEPRERDLERWQRYIEQAFVCDPNTGANPCQPPRGEGGRGRR